MGHLPNTSLGAALDPGRNSLNALRLLFAGAVIVSHAWWLGGYGPEPSLYGIKLGTAGVMGFFAISGYLITLSAQRSRSVGEFALARLTRIFPGLIVAAMATAFVAAPLGALLTGGRWDLGGALGFLGAAFGLLLGVLPTPPIGTTLQGNPDALDWNGPLWTLTWEILSYVVIAVVVLAARRLRGGNPAAATAFLFAAVTAGVGMTLLRGGFGPARSDFALPLMAFFLAGALLAQFRGRVPVGVLPLAVAVPIAWASLASSLAPILVPLPLAYLVLCLGSLRAFSRIGSRFDVSYGVYIYGWPVQQLLAAAHGPISFPALGYAALALVAVWPLAYLSCVLIEQPAQRWRRNWIRRRPAAV
ncbi:acyltransferase family protein [Sinomonas sp. P47F7]|uniref:acyltransferase family protein n=1 Tax=Sinomonas sp. P47F7 TaxID=3410987 RepID=UPI003BF46772